MAPTSCSWLCGARRYGARRRFFRPAAGVSRIENSAAPDEAARRVIARAAAEARPGPVPGFATPPGGAGFNRALSDARACDAAGGSRGTGRPTGALRESEALGPANAREPRRANYSLTGPWRTRPVKL